MAVHATLGHGFLKGVYQEALAVELARRSVLFAGEVQMPIRYKGTLLKTAYRADFFC